ncbi:hypothetical protein EZS27_021019 [termite gut metagenome]|uniref:Uncharacterized protein n=1 Tax=termite gut metagenome TaxID=433724 RepID=A0A5J4R839_9ZZZZ
MYISQSQIKNIVGNIKEFTRNIKETIGVTEEYSVSFDYLEKAERYINEYFRIIKILEVNNSNSAVKKDNIDKELKRFNDFIANITSEENKPKLEQYKKKIDQLEGRKAWYERLVKRKDSIIQFEQEVNIDLQKTNETLSKLHFNIPLINTRGTTDYIQSNVLSIIKKTIIDVQNEINETKKAFEGYTGDLTTLLDNVNIYQKKVFELQQEKKMLEDIEENFSYIREHYFKELGEDVKKSITDYKARIIRQCPKKCVNENYKFPYL